VLNTSAPSASPVVKACIDVPSASVATVEAGVTVISGLKDTVSGGATPLVCSDNASGTSGGPNSVPGTPSRRPADLLTRIESMTAGKSNRRRSRTASAAPDVAPAKEVINTAAVSTGIAIGTASVPVQLTDVFVKAAGAERDAFVSSELKDEPSASLGIAGASGPSYSVMVPATPALAVTNAATEAPANSAPVASITSRVSAFMDRVIGSVAAAGAAQSESDRLADNESVASRSGVQPSIASLQSASPPRQKDSYEEL
jgi:hypothetical protein